MSKPKADPATEIATIEEDVRLTGWGVFSLMLLILSVAFTAFAGMAAKTVFQQIEAGVSMIASLLLFGLGVALGRRRTYRIYRSAGPIERPRS